MLAGSTSKPAAGLNLLRVLTCGSVDDGKSTLLGRLLYDTGQVPSDHLEALVTESRNGDVDVSLLFDGLEAEREQGITIDVTHRAFSSARRRYRLLDAPGHEQYTGNMATAASGADLAILLVDARAGIKPQTRRHASICRLFGVRHLVLAINKMDLVDYDVEVMRRISADFARLGFDKKLDSLVAIPMSALIGDNVVQPSRHMDWYSGPSLLDHLDTIDVRESGRGLPFRLPIQLVQRDDAGRRTYLGTLASGTLRAGDEVIAMPSGRIVTVATLSGPAGPSAEVGAGEAVAVTLGQDIDLRRGDLLAEPKEPPLASSAFAGDVLWLAAGEFLAGRSYLLRTGTRTSVATVLAIRSKLDLDTLTESPTRSLVQNEIGHCHFALSEPAAFDPFDSNPATGAFILIDRGDFRTVAAGVIRNELRRASNIRPQAFSIGQTERADLKGQNPLVLWFTGLSGAGKSTIANLVEQSLHARGVHTMLLDGDNIRHGLGRDHGFTPADRVENIRRAGEVAKLMTEAGLIVLCSFISPFRAERNVVRQLVGSEKFVEIFVDAPIEECIRRDPKGLYAKAQAGQIPNLTGIGQAYEPPEQPDLHLHTDKEPPEVLAGRIVSEVLGRGALVRDSSR